MMRIRTAWLALLLLGSISAVAAMFTGSWRSPATADAMTDQVSALAEPGDDTQTKGITWPDAAIRQDASARPDPDMVARQEAAARQVVDPDPATLTATPFPAAPDAIASAHAMVNANPAAGPNMNLVSRHWHDANVTGRTPTTASPQQLKKMRDSKAEMRIKRSKAAANTKTCAPPSNALASLFRKLSLAPSCTI